MKPPKQDPYDPTDSPTAEVAHDPAYYPRPAEVWSAAKCEKVANTTASDGLGTPYSFKGYLGVNYGKHRYNGGIVYGNEWWPGENRPLPILAKGYRVVVISTWGYRLVKTNKKTRCNACK